MEKRFKKKSFRKIKRKKRYPNLEVFNFKDYEGRDWSEDNLNELIKAMEKFGESIKTTQFYFPD